MSKIKLKADCLGYKRGSVIDVYDLKRCYDITDEEIYKLKIEQDGDFILLNKELFSFMIVMSSGNV